MQHEITIKTDPRTASTPTALRRRVAKELGLPEASINDLRICRRSVDARGKDVKINLSLKVASGADEKVTAERSVKSYSPLPSDAPVMIIVGAGPAGLFAALKCIEEGIRPIVLERGRDVEARRLDLARISREKKIDEVSNYCYGEGGAGAFSDGKLFTRSKKRGDNEEVLQLLVQFGASENILIDAHPHIGSDRLPEIIKNIREEIRAKGGEVHFETKAERLLLDSGEAIGVEASDGRKFYGSVMLANGHSARDFIRNLHKQGINMEAKGIAVGVRLEHPQELIDRIQYHRPDGRGKYLPAAEYSFVSQQDGRGVYSFCMCPGGVIVPAGSSSGELVVNGMSASARSGKWSNSGMVVEIRPGDFPEYDQYGELSLLKFQEDLERRFYEEAGRSIVAPAQRMTDFANNRTTSELPSTSYAPGIQPGNFHSLLPSFISTRLAAGFREFGKKRPGFMSDDAVLIGLESRTSSPVRLPRDRETMEHIGVLNLYPVGEGAGYAGGIVSAAVDGINAVKAFKKKLEKKS